MPRSLKGKREGKTERKGRRGMKRRSERDETRGGGSS